MQGLPEKLSVRAARRSEGARGVARRLAALALCGMLLAAGALPANGTMAQAAAKTAAAKTAEAQTGATAKKTDNASNAAQPAGLKAKSAVLMEASTGRVLYENNAHEKLPPASITKVMTELLVLEAIEKGSLSFDEKITCSKHASSMGGSDIWLAPGETMTVRDLFKAMAISSANDAAVALGEQVAGTEQAFVNLMNEKAAQLGMKDTHFVNATGLDANGHLTTAYDIALMSRELMRHQQIFSYCTVWMDSLRGGKTQLTNTNKLIRFYQGANGLKTGSTGKAGYCVSAAAKRGNTQLIAVIMGADNSADRFSSAENLLDYGFTNWAVVLPKVAAGQRSVKVQRGVADTVEAAPSGSTSILVAKTQEKKVTQKAELVTDVMAPVERGQVLGQISFWVEGQKVGSVPLVANSAVARRTFWKAFADFFRALVAG